MAQSFGTEVHPIYKSRWQSETDLLLFPDDLGKLCVNNSWVQFATHQQRSLVVFNVAEICRLCQLDCRRKTLMRQQYVMVLWLEAAAAAAVANIRHRLVEFMHNNSYITTKVFNYLYFSVSPRDLHQKKLVLSSSGSWCDDQVSHQENGRAVMKVSWWDRNVEVLKTLVVTYELLYVNCCTNQINLLLESRLVQYWQCSRLLLSNNRKVRMKHTASKWTNLLYRWSKKSHYLNTTQYQNFRRISACGFWL